MGEAATAQVGGDVAIGEGIFSESAKMAES
jgi:hypothetical protein